MSDAMYHLDSPGIDVYARIRKDVDETVFAQYTEGPDGFYAIQNSEIIGLAAGDYPYKNQQGLVGSENAGDETRGGGLLHWSGTAALPPAADVTKNNGVAVSLTVPKSVIIGPPS